MSSPAQWQVSRTCRFSEVRLRQSQRQGTEQSLPGIVTDSSDHVARDRPSIVLEHTGTGKFYMQRQGKDNLPGTVRDRSRQTVVTTQGVTDD